MGNIASDVFFGVRGMGNPLILLGVASFLLLVSGVVNIILLQPSKIFNPDDSTVWKILIYVKGAMILLVCPVLNLIVDAAGGDNYSLKAAQLAFIVIIVILSSYAKGHRDQKTVKMLKADDP